ncbi:hypothetical protein LCGC14_2672430 [marine sediment metagenome]|uniref:RNA ligase domain-containing protein n=1 Tax=marine sediment metagenome TaxID=412755 RepID=A0A0F9CFP0_9ZZZZ
MSAPPYPKIENLYARKDDGRTLDIGVFRRLETQLISTWLATEKIDGTNIRVSLEETADFSMDWEVAFYGRTNKAQMPDFIQEYLEATFSLDKMRQLWRGQKQCPKCRGGGFLTDSIRCECVEPYSITLYGEAYGARIQKGGGDYRKSGDISFRLFDALVVEKYWMSWGSVVGMADRLGIKTVPLLDYGQAKTDDIVSLVREGFKSVVAEEEGTPRLAEGIVARTDPYLFDNNGRRVMFKTKTKDF